VTDILASEFQSFPGVVVIPVNRTLAALALRGKNTVETPRDALDLARENALCLDLAGRVSFRQGDFFQPWRNFSPGGFDLIVSNPPYVSEAEYETLDKNVKEYEPAHALLAGADGLDVYKRIAEKVDDFLKPDGALMMEIGYAQGPAIRELLENTGAFKTITIEKDFANNDRIAIGHK